MATVAFEGVTLRFGAAVALDALSLAVRERAFTVFTGAPGCGKSVLLRALVGLEAPQAGRILIDGRDVTGLSPATRPIGYVPQSFALYPHLTVRENIAYPLRLARAPGATVAAKVASVSAMLSITPLLDKTPDQLSGGEKQRVAVARGLAKDARIFVLDDPLVGLDYKLRERLMSDLKALRAELDATFLYATADPLEALTMAQDLVVMEAGRLVQHGAIDAVYAAPSHAASLRLVGFPRANLAPGLAAGGQVTAGPLRFSARSLRDGPVEVGLRPEALRLHEPDDQGDAVRFCGVVTLLENLGCETVVYLDCDGLALTMVADASAGPAPRMGASVALRVAAADIMVFDAVGGAVLCRGAG